ncbi:MAG TPA: L-glutamate gamma-semialdehyde dehydrogenase [Thermoanaerobaculia bacterium]|nr:L-glutamate gamma-semialdehyde dehydrogenase [Thermoanaerobaculia bacterium]
MPDGRFNVPTPVNEAVLDYAPGSPERKALKQRLDQMLGEVVEIPAIIGGREVYTGKAEDVVCPHDHGHVLAQAHQCGSKEVELAVEAAAEAWREWSEMPFDARAAIFLKAADLLAGPWRATVNAATILGQSKTCYQAEIDSACELIDFWRFNPYYADTIYAEQPRSSPGVWNRIDYRALEGFVFAVTPFNFTAIGGNLPTSPAIMGNTVLWKPASTACLSNYYVMRVLEEAGLPPGVINFLPGRGSQVGDPVLASSELAGIHFTGSTPVFQGMWRTIAENLQRYRGYPRIVGETGGKDFVFAHPSADPRALMTALIRGAFEYQGQKCSAASRAYVPGSLWKGLEEELREQIAGIEMGSPVDFRNFMAAVIDEKSFDNIARSLEEAKGGDGYEVVAGGGCDKSEGFFIEPTIVRSQDPRSRLMREEIFGPLLTLYVYDDDEIDEALALCDGTSPYALTGAIFARDRAAIDAMSTRLRHAAGNFYVNDKPTGAVVGQQPFGGARASGTNDKAGSATNLLRWTSMRSIKETFVPPTSFEYPHMAQK